MEEQFVPYDLTIQLNKLGMKLPFVFNYYSTITRKIKSNQEKPGLRHHIVAPLWQQAFDWFREKHNLFYVIHVHKEGYSFNIHTLNKDGKEEEFLFSTILGSISSGIYIKDYNTAKVDLLTKLIEIINGRSISRISNS